jgi:PKD repeat protein
MTYITPASTTASCAVTLAYTSGPPIANAGKNQTVTQGTQVIFNASKTISVGNYTLYTWTFTEGTAQTLNGVIANYTFANPGNYTVNLTVQDSYGTDTSTMIITVNPTPYTYSPTPTPIPTDTDSSITPSPKTGDAQTTSGSSGLPLTIIGILCAVTVFVMSGSVFWLRKRS